MSKTILIVEDEQAIADSIAYALRTDGFTPRHLINVFSEGGAH